MIEPGDFGRCLRMVSKYSSLPLSSVGGFILSLLSEAVKSMRINTGMGKESAMLLSIVCNNIIYYCGQDAVGRRSLPLNL